MKLSKSMIWSIGMTVLIVWVGTATGAQAQAPGFFKEAPGGKKSRLHTALKCEGRIGLVYDVADEAVHATPAVFGTGAGGGEGGQFDPVPVLSANAVTLEQGECLNAHLSAIIGSSQTYGGAPLTLFQVTLTPLGGGAPQHMVGHYPTPYGIASPAVATEAEQDVDMFSANFFQSVGYNQHEVPPGTYVVDVWWAGAPPPAQRGNIGAAFVLKLYQMD